MKKYLLGLGLALTIFKCSAAAVGFFNHDSTHYIITTQTDDVRSIASVTKLFTAMTIINSGVDLNEKIKVNGRSHGHVPRNSMVTRYDLLRAMLISSDNRAAETLANYHPGGFDQFIIDANSYVNNVLKLRETKIVDASGLLPGNVSNVNDLTDFLYQIKDNKVMRSIAAEKNAILTMMVPAGKKQKQITINLRNTNPQLWTYDNILISKTGYTNPAGRCVVMLVEKKNQLFSIVVLGTKNIHERSKIVKELLEIPVEPRIVPNIKTQSEITFEVPNNFIYY